MTSINNKEETFRRKEKVRRREDFIRLFKEGSRHFSKQYTLITVRNKLEYSRCAVSIRKKVGNAVIRNYEKRLCRELFRREKRRLRPGLDILVIVNERTNRFRSSSIMLKNLMYRYCSSCRG